MFNIMKEFPVSDLETSLRDAYRDDSEAWFRVDSRRQVYLMACMNYGLEQGLLKEERPIEEEQYTAYRFSFTDGAKERFT